MKSALLAAVCVAVIVGVLLATRVGVNLWSLATARGFFIPVDSSIFTFRVTKENGGSGEWWLYAEDDQHLFALDPTTSFYVSVSKDEQARCAQFDPTDQSTWCSPTRHPIPTQ
jgi:hypothetical protein